MKIKSNKSINFNPFNFFKNIDFPEFIPAVFGVISGIILTMIVVTLGKKLPPTIIFILVTMIIAGIMTIEVNNVFRRYCWFLIILVIVSESLLFGYVSIKDKEVIPITTIVTEIMKEESITKGDTTETVEVLYKKITFYDNNTTSVLGHEWSRNDDEVKFYSSISGKETYIEYFPFIKFKKKHRFIRD